MNILLTGANGFLGRRLAAGLQIRRDLDVTAAVRRGSEALSARIVKIQGLGTNNDWSSALVGQTVVIHAAARVHVTNDGVREPLVEYRRVNVDGTLNLARQAANAGVQRFIFISSIKVNGEQTPLGNPFHPEDIANPSDPYGISKWEAELGLQKIAEETGMEVVIVRPPLVYGPGVKGNFANLIEIVGKGLPLPLGAINNQRSMIALDNLVDLIILCIDHPNAANHVFLASDGQDLSTTELLRGLAQAMGKPARLLPMPNGLLKFTVLVVGNRPIADRLLSSLQVDISKTRELLSWTPPISVDEGLRRCFETQAFCS